MYMMRRRAWRSLLCALVSATTLAATSCGAAKDGSAADEAERAAPAAKLGAVIKPVPAEQWKAMVAAGMVRPGCPVTEASQLRRVEVNYVDFKGRDQRGHLIVNADTAKTAARIFTKLHDAEFPIKRMEGVENYDGDTLLSLRADNTSGYNCRRPDQINAPVMESPHANGRAIDINPVENPWMDVRCDCWSPSAEFSKRTPGPGKILRGGPVWQIFKNEGWIWQNIPVPDYMHFDTGYPSTPYKESQRVG
ncbi:M15 family metallopeptidase [Nocardioides aurantiacus]|uniref:M15 family metallopeptidase n=1 Tax=Nocardioides aurantiacus TaxID=86796 RepID=UPI00403FBF3E